MTLNEIALPQILIVDDDPVLGMSLALAIEACGLAPIGPVATVKEAVRTIEHTPLCGALLDFRLKEGEDSSAIAQALGEQGVPFAFLTGSCSPSVSAAAQRFCAPVVMKPIDDEGLNALLETFRGTGGALTMTAPMPGTRRDASRAMA